MLMRLNFNKWVFDLDPRKSNVISDAQTRPLRNTSGSMNSGFAPSIASFVRSWQDSDTRQSWDTSPRSGSRSSRGIHKCLRCSRRSHRRDTATRLRIVPLYSHGFG